MLRLGSISFINSLPVDWGILNGLVPAQVSVRRGKPAELNTAMLEGSLDVSPISALWYARHHRNFLLLPDLSISSESGVQSVLLFSDYPLKKMAGKKIAFGGGGFTTPALLEILCRLRYGFKPELVGSDAPEDEIAARLLIGDQALIENERLKDSGLEIIDLAREWEDWTSLPAVFAVWGVRRSLYETQPEAVASLAQDLIRSKDAGMAHLDEIVTESCRRTGLERGVIQNYFSHLSYDFNERVRQGLELYLRLALECGLLTERATLEPIPGQALAT